MNNLEVIIKAINECESVNILEDVVKYANYKESKVAALNRLEELSK